MINQKINVIWNFENSRFFDMNFALDCLRIYHQVDFNQDFHVQTAARTADICFCTTDYIKRLLQPYNPNVFKIHHGVSENAFVYDDRQLPDENRNGRKIRATYVGNLDIPYLDDDLLKELVEKFNNVEFVLVGAYKREGKIFAQLSSFPNIRFAGKVASERIKGFLIESDILLLCYRADKYKEQLASPHKMMEYLASGKVIVATYTDEYKDKRDLLVMSNTNKEYSKLFGQVVLNLNDYNSLDLQKRRIEFAKNYTYKKQLEKISSLIEEYVIGKPSG
jgi:glycosyltransferase involved in cell wall biosynthesis